MKENANSLNYDCLNTCLKLHILGFICNVKNCSIKETSHNNPNNNSSKIGLKVKKLMTSSIGSIRVLITYLKSYLILSRLYVWI